MEYRALKGGDSLDFGGAEAKHGAEYVCALIGHSNTCIKKEKRKIKSTVKVPLKQRMNNDHAFQPPWKKQDFWQALFSSSLFSLPFPSSLPPPPPLPLLLHSSSLSSFSFDLREEEGLLWFIPWVTLECSEMRNLAFIFLFKLLMLLCLDSRSYCQWEPIKVKATKCIFIRRCPRFIRMWSATSSGGLARQASCVRALI